MNHTWSGFDEAEKQAKELMIGLQNQEMRERITLYTFVFAALALGSIALTIISHMH